jgi:hypothetical protein
MPLLPPPCVYFAFAKTLKHMDRVRSDSRAAAKQAAVSSITIPTAVRLASVGAHEQILANFPRLR